MKGKKTGLVVNGGYVREAELWQDCNNAFTRDPLEPSVCPNLHKMTVRSPREEKEGQKTAVSGTSDSSVGHLGFILDSYK